MKILIDADACPVTKLVIELCKEKKIDVEVYFDTSHEFHSDYAKVFFIDEGNDSVDYFLLKNVRENDIVITQDYGLASLVLTKKGKCINQNGLIFSNNNIDTLLNSRYLSAKSRKAGYRTKGPSKRTYEDDLNFLNNLNKIL